MEAEETQVTQPAQRLDEKKATELAMLMGFLAAQGAKGDADRYRALLYTTFTDFLDGLGYRVVPK